MRANLTLTWFLVFFAIPIKPAWANEPNQIRLGLGFQKTLTLPNIVRASIGNPNIADIRAIENSNQLIITGKNYGKTNLILWDQNQVRKKFLVWVRNSISSKIQQIQRELSSIRGVETKKVGQKIFIEGEIYRNSDLEKIKSVQSKYQNLINLSRFNLKALQLIAQKVQEKLQAAGYRHLRVNTSDNHLVLTGQVKTLSDQHRAKEIAQVFFANVKSELGLSIANEPIIMVDVKFVEIHKNNLLNLGIDWPSSTGVSASAGVSDGYLKTSFGTSSSFDVNLRLLQEKGVAKLLSNPRLLCRNNTPASFLAGGQIPIRLISERSANVIFKPYGIDLKVKAEVDRGNRVLMDIKIKISDIDPSLSVEGLPGLSEHHIETAVDLSVGESIALGGLYQKRQRKSVRKTPLIGHIPVIGELFKSRSFQKNESEFLVVMTPKAGRPQTKTQNESLRRFKQMKNMNQGFEFSLMD